MGKLVELPDELLEYVEENVIKGVYSDDERMTRAFWYLIGQKKQNRERMNALTAQRERLIEAAAEVIFAPNTPSMYAAIEKLKTTHNTIGI